MKNSGKISHNVIQFTISQTPGNSSVIKFGSWDKFTLAPDTELHMLKTDNLESWNLKGTQVKFGDDIMMEKHIFVDIDPGVPYIYVPDEDFAVLIADLSKSYFDQGLKCVFNDNYCKFFEACSNVRPLSDREFTVTVTDGDSSYNMKIHH